jgi:hypothetical protein
MHQKPQPLKVFAFKNGTSLQQAPLALAPPHPKLKNKFV